MALKLQVSSIDEVDEKYRDQYKEVEEGGMKVFKLDVLGIPDDGPLKRAHERVKQELAAALEAGRKKGEDLASIEASYKQRLEDAEKAASEATKSVQKALKNEKKSKTLDDIAAAVAVDADSRDLVRLFAEKRVRIDIEDDRAIPRVLDNDGKVSSLSVDDLIAELKSDKRLARVAGASRGSGGGAQSESRKVGDAHLSSDNNKPPTNDAKQLAAWIKQRSAMRGAR